MADANAKSSEKATVYTQVVIIIAVLAALVAVATFQPEPAQTQLPMGGASGQQEASPQP